MNQDKHTIEMLKSVAYVAFKPSRADSHWIVNYLTTDLIIHCIYATPFNFAWGRGLLF